MLARLMAYVGALALLAIIGVHFWDQLPDLADPGPPAQAGWSAGPRSHQAFAVSQFDTSDKTETCEVFRHPEGGRKDVFRWTARDDKQGQPVAELEIYRPGGESGPSGATMAEIAARMDLGGRHERESAGVIDSKFSHVTLLRPAGGVDAARSCLGFVKRRGEPNLQISGWSCQGEALPARRGAISCMLGRLMPLTAGNDQKLAELFAHAGLRRGNCATAASAVTADWASAAEPPPRLRGPL